MLKGFFDFVREQGVIGLAVGFILGGAVSKLVSSLVKDIIGPILGIVLSKTGALTTMTIMLGPAEIMIGSFISNLIDFIVIAIVVYFGIKGMGLDKIDKKK
ncbi:hypothetical protein A2713_00235 [candidate division WWE3 bacterium RIFCSPHIGHO2_01_FULL_35_17]|uniref:Mechanosensitive ion channel protein MscL n=1 Tax=candidate division WWE3 bacterium RIFCSPHIGHO2_01_FULL_35_17 TaxID=1802614 RepID=A0A1F4URC7_UNCKA|nr:MAG: hypothetical protein A2713_00235 [candidate division WWE3 bacterium RIFCSPHIGHO2_01_FULL_35_17]